MGSSNRMFESVPPRLSHLPVSTPNSTVLSNGSISFTMGGGPTMNGQCDWMSRMQAPMGQNQFNPMRSNSQGSMHPVNQALQHSMMTSLHNGLPTTTLSQMMSYQGMQNTRLASQPHLMQTQQIQQMQHQQNLQQQLQQQQSMQLQHQNSNTATNGHTIGQNFIAGDLSQSDLQQLSGTTMPIHTILPQETQILPSSLSQPMPTTQFLTPPSQHSYSSPLDNTPNHQLQVPDHPFLTPSPESPDQWSSSSPHSMSDWSEGISSPPTSMQSQMGHIPDQFK